MTNCSNCGAPDCEIRAKGLESPTKKGNPDAKGIYWFCCRACLLLFIATQEELDLMNYDDPGKDDQPKDKVAEGLKDLKAKIADLI